jgi:hypothetical protein
MQPRAPAGEEFGSTGGSLGFVDCLVRADDQPIARGNATFRIFPRQ